jgi:hypothetical protein
MESPTTTSDHGRAPDGEAGGFGFGDGGLPVSTTGTLAVGTVGWDGVTGGDGVVGGVVVPAEVQATTSDATATA